jgi:hypothetical protein
MVRRLIDPLLPPRPPRDSYRRLMAWLTALLSVWLTHRYRRTATRSASPGREGEDERARRYAAELLTQAREELNRADAKASILLAGVGVALGAVVGTIVTKGWSPFQLPIYRAFVWWAGAAAIAAGSVALLAAVYPRRRQLGESCGAGVRYFGYYFDVAGARSAAEVAATIRQSAARELELVAEQLLQVSLIVDRKYRLVRWAMWMLAAGVSCDVAMAFFTAA